MKKKFKLFATIGSLALAICMMTIGVLAATQVTFSVTSNVSFDVTAVPVSVTGKVEYGPEGTRAFKEFSGDNFEGTSGAITSVGTLTLAPTVEEDNELVTGNITDTTVGFGDLTFANKDNNTIVYTFTIKNESSANMFVKITAPTVNADGVTPTTTSKVDESDYTSNTEIAAGKTLTYTYTLTITDVTKSIDSFAVAFTFDINNAAIV